MLIGSQRAGVAHYNILHIMQEWLVYGILSVQEWLIAYKYYVAVVSMHEWLIVTADHARVANRYIVSVQEWLIAYNYRISCRSG